MKKVGIIGGGISGVSAAWFIHHKRPDVELHIFDPNPQLGGKIQTTVQDGVVCEGGAFWLDAAAMLPFSRWLRKDLGLHDQLVPLRGGPRVVFESGQLHPFPDAPPFPLPIDEEMIRLSELLTVEGKERALDEHTIPPFTGSDDESLGQFFRRRFGDEFTQTYISPMFSSMFLTSIDMLSLLATMPKLRQLESKFGSLAAAKEKFLKLAPIIPSPALAQMSAFKILKSWMKQDPLIRLESPRFTLRYGLGEIIDAMREQIRAKPHIGQPVETVVRTDNGYLVTTPLESTHVDAVVCAAPAWATAQMLKRESPDLAALLDSISYASCMCASLTVKEASVIGLPGVDILVAEDSDLHIASCSRLSGKAPIFASEGEEILRIILRDKPGQSLGALSDDAVETIILEELATITGLHLCPELCRVHRLPNLLPTPLPGHLELLSKVNSEAAKLPDFILCGDAYCSGGIPGAVQFAKDQVEKFLR